MDFRLNLAKFKPSAGFAQQFKSAGCDGLTHPLVIPKPVLSARNLLTAGSETADSARGKPRLGMTTPWRLHHQNVIRVLDWPGSAVRRRSDRDDRRPWPRRPGVLYSLPGLARPTRMLSSSPCSHSSRLIGLKTLYSGMRNSQLRTSASNRSTSCCRSAVSGNSGKRAGPP